ncbi:AcrR family transcriptional regulator [Nocardioides aromaticivorans]|uniref:AcrR family transcriptional regulator n=1 Tax=Nocardioides aromaticivorans TaxID=200618 RepID=A0A7Z0CK69_9ACTN|nr:TetR/AcrR family transcriptional regulator [Nocardioides aromaticivorans]NYI44431.1 AcrR family transcriptional regulator [Nocardioides aromaticivorans]QSR28391.1 TetR family transcriptional regulator [Nocardioides aromaticivorans]
MARIPVAQRRRELVEAAVEVISTHGIDGATTRRIADQAKANVAMVHYCYDSKEDLFADVFEFVAGRFREVIEQSDPHTTVLETAQAMLRGLMECYCDSPSFAATTIELINWARRQHGDRGIAVYDQALGAGLEAMRRVAAAEGVADEVVEDIPYVVGALSDGFAINFLTYGDREAADALMDVTASVLESWLSARLGSAAAKRPRRKRAASA